ncbi:MAG TPA: flagellar basal-body rod protein FlgF [Zoogloea sp.]|uniref:flagellar basal-body rod protein FlgF n=1 Tax=Zoogloea sp. TaxID=49181 RepID=UPI002C14A753|nr:flagellar basal-body rod protein FlgF [Zoogloea sp.]HMV17674.1 flagellar basal-body rod protein FlgF [Rhodocyclaceae bacterium]HMV62921.1 flagellar basal-body rod protein FlgF [Rhodocyclaceae bacterium]HMY50049.1 flagellar basal-body rod protein FlgF [Rhodocyclaceae bacterium]HMZ76334.1 flagellar basal-body rod protein FlgF [Rhodocyclaceae bacterium]HNA66627.1 flagellar basal-body rod protein FlgF [Rhodocyclaceae bacterium]
MDRLIYTAMTGAAATLGQQAAVAHNMANATSTGFRAELHRLRAVPVQNAQLPTRAFVVDASVSDDFSTGPLQHTGHTYDMAIQGKGWFAVQMPDGSEAYTRDGSFEVSANGVLQTRSGLPVLGGGGPITIPPDTEVIVGADGTVSTVPSSGARNTTAVVDQLKLVNPPEQDLQRGGDGLFRLAGGTAAPADPAVRVASGYLEGSNVNVVEQMVSMISLSRQFEMQTKMLTTAQENDRSAAQVITKA